MISQCRVRGMWVWPVLLSLAGAAPTVAQVPEKSASSAIRPADRPDWGGSDRVLYAIAAIEFSPTSSDVTYHDTGGQPGRYATVASGSFYATLHLPSGVLLTRLELDYCDNTAMPGRDVLLSLHACPFAGTVCTQVGSLLDSSAGAFGCSLVFTDMTPLQFVTDNNAGRLVLRARTVAGDSSNVLLGAYIGYKLQVSPAPASATFLDVPTTHAFFRFVEALSNSGITAGCGGSRYCPDQPLTRGQMAVFLSVALGLHFPN